jgi:hypothetical protein
MVIVVGILDVAPTLGNDFGWAGFVAGTLTDAGLPEGTFARLASDTAPASHFLFRRSLPARCRARLRTRLVRHARILKHSVNPAPIRQRFNAGLVLPTGVLPDNFHHGHFHPDRNRSAVSPGNLATGYSI